MKKSSRVPLLFILSLFVLLLPGPLQAETRNLYVGDLIQLKIATQRLSMDELADKFADFEIVRAEEDNGGYLLTLRSFEPGEYKVLLEDKELVFTIRSTLDDIEREGIFEGNMTPEKAGFSLGLRHPFYGLLIVFLLSGGGYGYTVLKKRKNVFASPGERFFNQMERVSADDEQYVAQLTFYLKEYVEAAYSCRIRGKTTAEMTEVLQRLPGLRQSWRELGAWLEEANRLKFSGIAVSEEKKREFHDRLVHLVRKIDELKENAS